jgi:hypothetical protein
MGTKGCFQRSKAVLRLKLTTDVHLVMSLHTETTVHLPSYCTLINQQYYKIYIIHYQFADLHAVHSIGIIPLNSKLRFGGLYNALHGICVIISHVVFQEFGAHKLFLAMSSPVFEAMFFGGMAEKGDPIPILDVQPEAFKALLE